MNPKQINLTPDEIIEFWKNVFKLSDEDGGCWIWTAYRHNQGYGRPRIGGRNYLAHRVAWTITYGQIPEGFDACHDCDVPSCLNPSHLFLGTQLDNMRDMNNKMRCTPASGDNHGLRIHPDAVARGEENGNVKLNSIKVTEIRERILIGEPVIAVAKNFNVSRSAIEAIINGRTWRHVKALPILD